MTNQSVSVTSTETRSAPLLIGLCGYAGVGKDTVADILAREHGFMRYAFANSLKTLARDLGWDGAKDERGRRFLQALGVAMRELDPDYWIDKVRRPILHMRHFAGHPIVISDVRFKNEAEWIREKGGILVRVVRPGFGPVNEHVSESDLDDVPVSIFINNRGTLSDLARSVSGMLASLDIAPAPKPKHRVYIAGPMTKYAATDWNYPLFNRVADEIRAQGHDVWNPAENFDGRTDLPREVYMRKNLRELLDCTAMVLLPEWIESDGARCEKINAEQLNLKIVEYRNGVDL